MIKLKKESCLNCVCNKESVFANLDETNIDIIDRNRVVNKYKKGQSLFLQDNPAYGVFCITSGKVKLVKTNNVGNESIVCTDLATLQVYRISDFDSRIAKSAILIRKPYCNLLPTHPLLPWA